MRNAKIKNRDPLIRRVTLKLGKMIIKIRTLKLGKEPYKLGRCKFKYEKQNSGTYGGHS